MKNLRLLSLLTAICVLPPGLVGAEVSTHLAIDLDIPGPEDSAGGIIAADVNDDGKPDFLVTVPGHLAVYGNGGKKLWIKKTPIVVGTQSESQGLPGHHGPGVAAGDVAGGVESVRGRAAKVGSISSGRHRAL